MCAKIRVAKTKRIEVPAGGYDTTSLRRRGLRIDQDLAAKRKKKRPQEPKRDENYRQLLDSIYDAVLITNMSGNILDVNPRAMEFLLFSGEELCGMNVMSVVSGADKSLLDTIVENLQTRRYALVVATCLRKDGSGFPAEIAISKITWPNREELCCSIRDLTVRRQGEKALKEALSRLEERDRSRSLLVSNVSHELKTPVTSISYGISNLLKGTAGPIPEDLLPHLERFHRECRRLLVTANEILDLQNIESHTMTLTRVVLPLSRVVERSVEALQLHAEHKGVKVTLQCPQDIGFVDCDPLKMERVCVNIIGNAIKYTPAGGEIDIVVLRDPERYKLLVLRVTDSGIGIPPHALQSVTERYFRVGAQADGSGLGLAISREIVEMHGGAMELVSPPPERLQGTQVELSLSEADEPAVLLLSANEELLRRVHEQMDCYGYNVVHCPDTAAINESVGDEEISIVIVDPAVSGGDGIPLIMRIKTTDETKDTPVVVVAEDDLDAAKKEILRSLAVPAVTGAWRKDELLEVVEAVQSTSGS